MGDEEELRARIEAQVASRRAGTSQPKRERAGRRGHGGEPVTAQEAPAQALQPVPRSLEPVRPWLSEPVDIERGDAAMPTAISAHSAGPRTLEPGRTRLEGDGLPAQQEALADLRSASGVAATGFATGTLGTRSTGPAVDAAARPYPAIDSGAAPEPTMDIEAAPELHVDSDAQAAAAGDRGAARAHVPGWRRRRGRVAVDEDGADAELHPRHAARLGQPALADTEPASPFETYPGADRPMRARSASVQRVAATDTALGATSAVGDAAVGDAAIGDADSIGYPPAAGGSPAERPEATAGAAPAQDSDDLDGDEYAALRTEWSRPTLDWMLAPRAPLAAPGSQPVKATDTDVHAGPAVPLPDDHRATSPESPTIRPGSDLARRLAAANAVAMERARSAAPAELVPDDRPVHQDFPFPAGDDQRIAGTDRPRRRRNPLRALRRTLIVVAVVVLAGYLLRTYVAASYHVPSASMEPTLHGCAGCNNDRVLVDKLSYRMHDIRRGDVVVFHRSQAWLVPDKVLIRRVIGLPGDTLTTRNGIVYVNGLMLAEPYLNSACRGGTPDFPPEPVTVPDDHAFVMGDNRCDRSDSRRFGAIADSAVIGRAFMIVWRLDRIHWV